MSAAFGDRALGLVLLQGGSRYGPPPIKMEFPCLVRVAFNQVRSLRVQESALSLHLGKNTHSPAPPRPPPPQGRGRGGAVLHRHRAYDSEIVIAASRRARLKHTGIVGNS
jgi:hypothetical protein